ncbi:uncharacterized protein LOC132041095 [Lycium ferocissimum]|uniref:uncharacterized protein LOC132041095 n=1 Tax=Lycium ferocissimum TaxID=112874 RepID=UPI0028167C7A|nr:uncharacterized protein LOC132041095 [Lycium ferocissimum]XP_059287854.1 uncharacterized protein LOC132041095 [Lycium ferocissimum]
MDMEFKLARVADEFTSNEFLQFGKDRAGLFFQSAETNTMFILTAHLKGYTRENIKINIDEEGNKMVITCEKQVQETVKVGGTVIEKDVEIRKFTKAFKIPDGVILDKIETNFNKEASILTITMPKRVEGILGTGIQEVKEPENLPFRVDEIPRKATFHEDKGAEFSSAGSESAYRKGEASQETEMQPGFPSNIQKSHAEVKKPGAQDEVPQRETEKPKAEPKSQKIEDMGDGKLECTNLKDDKICEKANGIEEEKEDKLPERRSKICVPVIAGSAVILSLVVFGIYFMRNKKQPGKRKE